MCILSVVLLFCLFQEEEEADKAETEEKTVNAKHIIEYVTSQNQQNIFSQPNQDKCVIRLVQFDRL